MIRRLHLFFHRLTNIGVETNSDLPLVEQFSTKVMNQGAFCMVLLVCVVALLGYINDEPSAILMLVFVPLQLLILVLNNYQKYFLAKLHITVVLPIFVVIFLILFGNKSGIQSFIIFFSVYALIIYQQYPEYYKVRFFNILYLFVLFAAGVYYNYLFPSILAESVHGYESYLFISINFLVVLWGFERFGYLTTIHTDILNNKNQELEKQNQELLKLVQENNTKTKLLSVVTHDLRGAAFTFNNLTKRINYLIRNNEPEMILTLGNFFEEKGEKLIFNIENLLSWIISQQESIEVDHSTIHLRKTVEDVIENLHFVANEKNISIINHIETPTLIHSDVNILKVIIHNIISNAIKYSHEKSKVDVEFTLETNFYNIMITDEGEGMAQEKLDLLQQQEDVIGKISNQGYGIVLSICFSFIKALNGKLLFEKRRENGIIVTIQLPNSKETSIESENLHFGDRLKKVEN